MNSSVPEEAADAAFRDLSLTSRHSRAVVATSSPRPVRRGRVGRTIARLLLTLYAVTLAVIAVWPTRVDLPAAPLLRRLLHAIPWLTYDRIEFGANILLFVPLGLLLALILTHRHLILPIALVTTVTIESVQAILLSQRTPSVMDILANTTGACLGLLIVALIEWPLGAGRHRD
jgi:VanZ family protein